MEAAVTRNVYRVAGAPVGEVYACTLYVRVWGVFRTVEGFYGELGDRASEALPFGTEVIRVPDIDGVPVEEWVESRYGG